MPLTGTLSEVPTEFYASRRQIERVVPTTELTGSPVTRHRGIAGLVHAVAVIDGNPMAVIMCSRSRPADPDLSQLFKDVPQADRCAACEQAIESQS